MLLVDPFQNPSFDSIDPECAELAARLVGEREHGRAGVELCACSTASDLRIEASCAKIPKFPVP
jgi:hypothetical protein